MMPKAVSAAPVLDLLVVHGDFTLQVSLVCQWYVLGRFPRYITPGNRDTQLLPTGMFHMTTFGIYNLQSVFAVYADIFAPSVSTMSDSGTIVILICYVFVAC